MRLRTPLTRENNEALLAGRVVLISGVLYAARGAAGVTVPVYHGRDQAALLRRRARYAGRRQAMKKTAILFEAAILSTAMGMVVSVLCVVAPG